MIPRNTFSAVTSPSSTQGLTRERLLAGALVVLDQAAELEARVMRGDDEPWLERCLERLGAHREILARRAGNVALAPVVTAEELTELRQACSRLYALQGAIARKLGGLRHLS